MKTAVVASLAILILAARVALADDVHVYKDDQGVSTYTNEPRSQRVQKPPKKDAEGVRTYTNLPASGVRKPSAASPTSSESPLADEGGTLTVVPEPRLQEPPPPPRDEAQGAASGSATGSMAASPAQSDGQWVFTNQYGWVWMPYGAKYVSEGSPGDESPYAYVYEPSEGWTWCAAPWVWGWGPYPYFGALGPGRFGWYRGLVHAGYGWGGYRGGGPGRAGFARSFATGHRGASFGRGFTSRAVGGGFHGGSGFRGSFHGGGGFHGSFHSAPAAHGGFSHGGGFSGGHAGGYSGGHAGGHGGGGRR